MPETMTMTRVDSASTSDLSSEVGRSLPKLLIGMKKIKLSVFTTITLVLLLFVNSVVFAATQTRSPSTCASVSGIGSIAWSNPTRATAVDASYATASSDGNTTQYLRCTGYGFSIPSGASITGITVYVTRRSNSTSNGGSRDAAMRLVKGGTIGTTDYASSTIYTLSDVTEDHGGALDLWGTSWTVGDINAANFGAAFAASKPNASGGAQTISVDAIQISVDYTLPCAPPANIPAGLALTCLCDNFGRASLSPSTIYGGDWAVSNSDGLANPYINTVTGLLRLTENTGYNAKSATVPGIFPAAGNYISVEFNHYAYNGTTPGADGIAVTLSDSSVPAVPGGFGGSLGYAQRNDGSQPPGFAGGWIGVALDEYGNYQNPTEGRLLGPGAIAQSIAVRGPGSGANGYRWLGGTSGNPGGLSVDNRASTVPAPGYLYQVIVDARSFGAGQVTVAVNRDATSKDGTNYSSLFGPFNAYTEANYALGQNWITKIVPDYWKISFTGSTGGSSNIHEVGGLRICAQTSYPPTGGIAKGYSAIDEAYPAASGSAVPAYQNFQTGDIYMKLTGVPFKLWIAALTDSAISSAYSATTNKYVQVKLVNNADNACGTDAARTCTAACTGKAAVESSGSQILTYTSSDPGAKLSQSFQLNSAWKNLVAVMTECTTSTCANFTSTTPACSVDSFSVRPTGIASVTSSNATNAGASGTPIFKAGSDQFALTATTTGVTGSASGYTGLLKINNAAVQAINPASVAGLVATIPATTPPMFPAASSGTPSSTSTGTNFTYDEVGGFRFLGYDPASDTSSARGVYDGVMTSLECSSLSATQCDALKTQTWTGVDSLSTKGDCIVDSFSNTKATNGKYGCNFGIVSNTGVFGRFVPYQYALISQLENRADIATCSTSTFTYFGEQLNARFTLTAQSASGATTKNYAGTLAKLDPTVFSNLNMAAIDRSISPPYKPVIDTTGVPAVTCGSTPCFVAGVASNISAPFKFVRNASAEGPLTTMEVGINPVDADGVTVPFNLDVTTATNPGNAFNRGKVGQTQVRYGRLQIDNAYGSQLLPLSVNLKAQYWNGSAYVLNTDDSCTPLTTGNFSLSNKTGGLVSASVATLGSTTTALATGSGTVKLDKPTPTPTARGSVDLNSAIPYLPGSGRETYGIYKAGSVIYLRELF